MKKRLLSVALGAMLAAGALAVVIRDAAFDLVHAARERWRDPFPELGMLAVSAPRAPVSAPAPAPQPRVGLVVSKSFLASLAHRMRPTVTPWWRMCPSA